MISDKKNHVTLEECENEFSYTKSKTNLNIEFNRIAFIFFIFLTISIIFSIHLLHLGSLKKVESDIKKADASLTSGNGDQVVPSLEYSQLP